MTNTVHGLTKATYRETLRGLQSQQMRVAYGGPPYAPSIMSYDDLEEEINRVTKILDNWDLSNER